MSAKSSKVHRTSVSEIWRGEDGIIRSVYFKPNTVVTLENALENRKVGEALYDGSAMLWLIDIRNVKSTTKEAREIGASEETARRTGAMAILVESQMTKTIGNLFMKLNQPKYPTRMFTEEKDAVAWLLSQSKQLPLAS